MNVRDAASYLGVSPKTLYKWKRRARHNNGHLIFSGRAVRFRYRQTGTIGQGRIFFERQWLDDIKQAMESEPPQQRSARRTTRPHLRVPLGLPPE